MRYSIIGSLGPGNIEKAYSKAAIQLRERNASTPASIFALLKTIYPDDDRFQQDFAVKEISRAKLARYILSSIAVGWQNSNAKVIEITEDEKITTLEHIMPKSRTDDWSDAATDEAEYRANVDRLATSP